jgi:hypothetical protein
MSSIFGRLNFNFDDSKFGSSLYLPDETKEYLNTAPTELQTWQINDIANGNIQMTDYYQNPVINVTNQLKNNVITLQSVISTIEFYDYVVDSANLISGLANLVIQIEEFKKHTDNVCGANSAFSTTNESGTDAANYPDYDLAVNLGQQLLLLTNTSDGVQNATPLLGSMTSLFVGDDISSNSTTLQNDRFTVNNSLRLVTVGDSSNIYCNLTSTQMNTLISHVTTANTLLGGRREHDWNFFRTGLQVMDDYYKVDKLTRLGNTQTYLVTNLIGTDKYKNNISANT